MLPLMKNVRLIGAMFVGDVNRRMDFFDQGCVRYKNNNEDEDLVPPTP